MTAHETHRVCSSIQSPPRGVAPAVKCIGMALLILGSFVVSPLSAQEYFIHVNGDSVVCDVKGLSYGKLEFEIDGANSAMIEYDKVSTIGSVDFWDIELEGQRRLLGSVLAGPEPGTVLVAQASDTVQVVLAEIVQMRSIDATFWSRFEGFVELGFSFAKANKATNYSLVAQIDYRATDWLIGYKLDSRLQSQDDAETTKRNQTSLEVNRLLPKTWSVGVFGQAEQNQQLSLDLRVLAGAVSGRDILQTNRVEWRAFAGLLGNREDYVGADPAESAEGLVGTSFRWFTFGNFENSLTSNLSVYPSLTESGRVRLSMDANYRQDLFGDLYLSFSFYDEFDSQPPTGGEENDFGTTLALGWDI